MLPKGNLDRVQDFDKDDDQQNPVEQRNDVICQIAGDNLLNKKPNLGYE